MASGSSGGRGRGTPPPGPNDRGKGKAIVGEPSRRKKASSNFPVLENPGFLLSDFASTIQPHTPDGEGSTSLFSRDNEDNHVSETQPYSHREQNADTDSDHSQVQCSDTRGGKPDPRKRHRAPCGRWFIRPTPGFNGFLPSKSGSSSITRVIKERYNKFWPNWSVLTDEDKEILWKAFKDICTWNQEYESVMKSIFFSKAAQRLRDMLSKVHKKMKRPEWIGVPIWDQLVKHWEKPNVMALSEQNKKNRASDTGGTLHTGGSINTAEHKERMEYDAGRPISLPELHRALHYRKNGEPVDERSRQLQEDFQACLTQRTQSCSLDPSKYTSEFQLQEDVWMDTTGGFKKGRLPGAGVLASCYRQMSGGSSSRSSTGRSYIQDQAVVSELARKLTEAQHVIHEERKKREDLSQQVEAMRAQHEAMRAQHEAMRAQQEMLINMFQGRGGDIIFPTPRPTPRPTFASYMNEGHTGIRYGTQLSEFPPYEPSQPAYYPRVPHPTPRPTHPPTTFTGMTQSFTSLLNDGFQNGHPFLQMHIDGSTTQQEGDQFQHDQD